MHLALTDLEPETFYIHFVTDPNTGSHKVFNCEINNCPHCEKAFALNNAGETSEARKLWKHKRIMFSVIDLSNGNESKIQFGSVFIDAYEALITSDLFDCDYPVSLRLIKTQRGNFPDWSNSMFVINKERYMIPLNDFKKIDFISPSSLKTDCLFQHPEQIVINTLQQRLKEGWAVNAILSAAKINNISVNELKIWGNEAIREALT